MPWTDLGSENIHFLITVLTSQPGLPTPLMPKKHSEPQHMPLLHPPIYHTFIHSI